MRKVPFIFQFNSTECGACVIAMILHYYGAYYTLQEIREQMPVTRDGTTIKMLIDTFSYYGIEASAYHATLFDLLEYQFPMIINWTENHYVILEKITEKYVWIVDSGIGRLKISHKEFDSKYSGIVILLKKGDKFEKKKREIDINPIFTSLFSIYKSKLIIFALLTFIMQIFMVIIPIAVQYFVDGIIANGILVINIILLLCVFLVVSLFRLLREYYASLLGVRMDRDVNTSIISKLLRVPYEFYEKKSNAEILYSLENIHCIKDMYLNYSFGMIFDATTIVFISCYLLYVDWSVFLVVLGISIPQILAIILTDSPIQQDLKLMIKEDSEISASQVEILHSILGIKTANVESAIFKNWQIKYDEYYQKSMKYQIKLSFLNELLSMVTSLSPIIILVVVALYTQKGIMTIGTSLGIYTMTNLLFDSIHTVLYSIRNFRNNKLMSDRIKDIMQEKELSYAESDNSIDIQGDIEIKNVNFKYSQSGENVLKNVSCTIPQNSKVAIIGNSGSGKSTLLKLLACLYDLKSGEILYNKKSVCKSDKPFPKQQIGFVAQNTWLMNKSIYENITLGLSDVEIQQVENACKIVNIHDEIMKMPMKYQTIISETGKNISGGQCQRIILARMVLLNPKVLILDEATSAIDILNEKKILEYFYRMKSTIIMVTHKKDFLKNCDSIIVMHNGEIIAQGTYDELFKSCDVFGTLLA